MNNAAEERSVETYTQDDARQFLQCEQVIGEGLKTFIEVGQALLEIKNARLYRKQYHTFEEYCIQRWKMSIRQAQRFIQSSKIASNIQQGDQSVALPTSEYQIRTLASLAPREQQEVWQELNEQDAPITGRLIQTKVKQLRERQNLNQTVDLQKPSNVQRNKVYLSDCLDVLQKLPGKSVDLILQDPPYGCTQNEWDTPINLDEMWEEWERVIKDNGTIIFTAAQPFASHLIMSHQSLFKYDLIWHKPLGSGFLNANKMPLRNHEHILVFYKALPTYNPQKYQSKSKSGQKKRNSNGPNYGAYTLETDYTYDDNGERHPNSIISIRNGNRNHKGNYHPTQKPVDLFRYLIRTYTNSGDLVFDGYAGSGTTAIACIQEDRDFILCEKQRNYFDIISERIRKQDSI